MLHFHPHQGTENEASHSVFVIKCFSSASCKQTDGQTNGPLPSLKELAAATAFHRGDETAPAVSVAAAAFVALSGAGQADKRLLRSVRGGVTGVGMPPHRHPKGVGATLLTAEPRGRDSVWRWHRGHTQGMGRDLACVLPQKDQTDPTLALRVCVRARVCVPFEALCVCV